MSNKMYPEGVVDSAMHLIDGLVSENTISEVLETWDRGCLELYNSLIPFAEKCHDLYEEGFNKTGGGPGVFDYEVAYVFGGWYGERILDLGDAPCPSDAEAHLKKLNDEFWAQMNPKKEDS